MDGGVPLGVENLSQYTLLKIMFICIPCRNIAPSLVPHLDTLCQYWWPQEGHKIPCATIDDRKRATRYPVLILMTAKSYPVHRHVPVTFNMEVPPPPPGLHGGSLFRTFNSYSFNFNGGLRKCHTAFCLLRTPSPRGKQFLWFLKMDLLRFHCIYLLLFF